MADRIKSSRLDPFLKRIFVQSLLEAAVSVRVQTTVTKRFPRKLEDKKKRISPSISAERAAEWRMVKELTAERDKPVPTVERL